MLSLSNCVLIVLSLFVTVTASDIFSLKIYDINSGTNIAKLVEEASKLKLETILTKSRSGQAFVCYVPSLDESNSSDANNTFNMSTKLVQERLKQLHSTSGCPQLKKGWWSYELCFGTELVQFHADKPDVRPADVISLGKFSHETNWDNIVWNATAKRRTKTHHAQVYVNGSVCDITGGFRQSEVRFFCSAKYALSVTEPISCHYLITVNSPVLCDLPPFMETEQTVQTTEIPCVPQVLTQKQPDAPADPSTSSGKSSEGPEMEETREDSGIETAEGEKKPDTAESVTAEEIVVSSFPQVPTEHVIAREANEPIATENPTSTTYQPFKPEAVPLNSDDMAALKSASEEMLPLLLDDETPASDRHTKPDSKLHAEFDKYFLQLEKVAAEGAFPPVVDRLLKLVIPLLREVGDPEVRRSYSQLRPLLTGSLTASRLAGYVQEYQRALSTISTNLMAITDTIERYNRIMVPAPDIASMDLDAIEDFWEELTENFLVPKSVVRSVTPTLEETRKLADDIEELREREKKTGNPNEALMKTYRENVAKMVAKLAEHVETVKPILVSQEIIKSVEIIKLHLQTVQIAEPLLKNHARAVATSQVESQWSLYKKAMMQRRKTQKTIQLKIKTLVKGSDGAAEEITLDIDASGIVKWPDDNMEVKVIAVGDGSNTENFVRDNIQYIESILMSAFSGDESNTNGQSQVSNSELSHSELTAKYWANHDNQVASGKEKDTKDSSDSDDYSRDYHLV